MRYEPDLLRDVFDRDHGRCNLCGSRRIFSAYGRRRERGHWEPDHSNPLANGGTNLFRNLRVACICCNRAKGAMSTRAFRRQMGYQPSGERGDNRPGTLLAWMVALGIFIVLHKLSNSPSTLEVASDQPLPF